MKMQVNNHSLIQIIFKNFSIIIIMILYIAFKIFYIVVVIGSYLLNSTKVNLIFPFNFHLY